MQNSQKDTADLKLNVSGTDLGNNFYRDLSGGFKQC